MPRFPSAQGRLNHEPDSTFAVTKTCPKDGVHLSPPPAGRGAGEAGAAAEAIGRAAAGGDSDRSRAVPVPRRRPSQGPRTASKRAVGSDPAGCASRRAHRVETAIAFRLHNALGTQNERYFVAVNPTAHSLACLRIGVVVTADAARLATGVGGSPFTGRVSHPLDGEQRFMTSPHRHSPLTSLAWSHQATTPPLALTPWGRVYLHRFHAPDPTCLHDHRWRFWSLVTRNLLPRRCNDPRLAHNVLKSALLFSTC